MFRTIGTTLAGAPSPSGDRQPVRRHSRLAGRCEGTFWQRTNRQEVRRVLLAARRYELAGRAPGRRNGPLGHVGLEALELLTNLVSFRTGQLDPSLDTLTRLLRRSRAAVVRALRALRAHGFLDWLRRYEPTGQTEGRGPRVRQVSNAYRLSLPARAARLLGRHLADPPLPEDVAHAQEARAADLAAHKAGLSLDELALFEIESGSLAQALAVYGSHVQDREFTREPESQSKGILG